MAEEIAIITADWHLASRAWSDRPIEGDSYFSLKQIVDQAIERNVLAVIGAGDLFDSKYNKAEPIAMFSDQMSRLQTANIDMWFTQGNHEAQFGRQWCSVHPWPDHLHQVSVQIGPFKFFGLDWTAPPLLQVGLAAIPPGTDVVVLHQAFSEWFDLGAEGRFSEISSARIGFAGDLHKIKRTVTRGRDGQELTMYSPGATSMNDITESPDKYFLVLHGDGSVKAHQLKTRKMFDIGVLARPEDLDNFVATIGDRLKESYDSVSDYPESIRKPLVRVVYPHWLEHAQRRITQAVGPLGHLFLKELPPDQSSVSESGVKPAVAGKAETLESMLPDFLERHELTHLADSAGRLLAAQDIETELLNMRKEIIT
jgi:hypothetical protein